MSLFSILVGLSALVAPCAALQPEISMNATRYWSFLEQLKAVAGNISLENPPFTSGEATIEATCRQMWFSCAKTVFFDRHYMRQKPTEVEIIPHLVEVTSSINDADGDDTYASDEARAVFKGTTKGWQIQARIGFSMNNTPVSGEVSAVYKDETTTSETTTTNVRHSGVCHGHSTCASYMVTFQARLKGTCTKRPYLLCTNTVDWNPEIEMDWCDTSLTSYQVACDQYAQYYLKNEERCKAQVPDVACEVVVQLSDDEGKPIRKYVRLPDEKDRRRRRRI